MSLGLVAAWSLHPAPAQAQPAQNPVLAQALFEEAQKLVAARDYTQACPKFKASYELDPGGGTLLNLADCYEKEGKTALAWSTFKDAQVAARRDGRNERAEYAARHIAELEKKLVYLQVDVPEASRSRDLRVEVDGAALAEAAWGLSLPVDPGNHVVRAEAPGKQAYEQTKTVPAVPGTREIIEIPPLSELGASASLDPAGAETSAAQSAAALDRPSSTQRTIGWVVTGAGVVSLGVGSYFGVKALSHWSDRNDGCARGCTPEAKAAGDDASTAANLATVGVGLGVLAVGVGIVLIASAPDPDEAPEHGRAGWTQLAFEPSPGGGQIEFRSTW